jgi:hypothetical protein
MLVPLTGIPASVEAYPTSNNYIPTADILEPGLARIELENDAFPRLFSKRRSQNYLLTQWGLSRRLEIGVDTYDFSNDGAYAFNAKFLALPETKRHPALALGIADVGNGLRPSTYAIATKSLATSRYHFGAWHNGGATVGMVGTDYKVNADLYLLADWTSGPSGYLTGGVYRRVQGELWLNVGAGRPNNSANEPLILVNLGYTFKFR